MTTLDTLSVRFEADTAALFSSLDALETRLAALHNANEMPLTLSQEIETRLTVTADEAISRALNGAGERLSQAVEHHDAAYASALTAAGERLVQAIDGHEVAFGSALAAAEQAMAAALQNAVNRLQSAINITVPVSVDGYRLGTATLKGLKQQSLAAGKLNAPRLR